MVWEPSKQHLKQPALEANRWVVLWLSGMSSHTRNQNGEIHVIYTFRIACLLVYAGIWVYGYMGIWVYGYT